MNSRVTITLPGYGPFYLAPDANIPCSLEPIQAGGSFESLEVLQRAAYDYVYRAQWTGRTQPQGGRATPLDVVLKLHYCRRITPRELEREAEMYGHARGTQGYSIPRCYGLFRGAAESDPNEMIVVLVLEYCGENLTDPKGHLIDFYDMDRDRQKMVAQQTVALHHFGGLEHNDLYARNVVWTDDNRAVIVDLAHANKHECKQRGTITRYTMIPEPLDFGCDEIHDICLECRIWFSPEMEFVGQIIPASSIYTLEDILRPVKESGEYLTPRRMAEAEQILEEIEFRRKHYPSSLKSPTRT
ncbi:hypothetical protein PUNSTDRAFT_144030 [Punctularia strigosozonata HHB-11173 SS5]|uniref:uncharacterized protein n=1 Tax=Punctularia strigosozonata (strain HHB-11173) TaxID=741275 RepID=UPI00044169E5|nr:uncharacterized protein PUNSTDRAFT_144030 [Punctularia strigosozonata HHB-11173 SS5]EIN08436.1 hypothetical protein PUNSTDRAFT_144030 [Punctularia strigosozonata HHB-11173 SS5]